VSFKFNEVACCIAMTRHLMDPTFLVFSLPEWKKLSAKEQQILAKAARDAGESVKGQAAQREADSLAQVKKLGMRVNEIDLAPLQRAAAAAQEELAREFGAEKLLEQIRKAP
jgi:TRAP-type C4-dicarboxylate transport system substrate-binding protein